VTNRSGQIRNGAYAACVVLESWVVEAHGLRSLCHPYLFTGAAFGRAGRPGEAEMVPR
jgi:hypothetical protein